MSNILIGISGGIAAYKVCYLIREFIKSGNSVKVIMTANAAEFVSPLTFETLSGNIVYINTFSDYGEYSPEHISLSKWADIFLVAPATANIIGKFRAGIADDLLSTEYLAFKKPVVIAPAMNDAMYEHPAVAENISMLRKRGVFVIEPDYGELACGGEGVGRLPSVEKIAAVVYRNLEKDSSMSGKKIVVTGGALYEPIDPVRIISNRSSGKMASAFIDAAYRMKAESITFVHGRLDIELPFVSENIFAPTASEMLLKLQSIIEGKDILIMAAAVSDFKPEYSNEKIKKKNGIDIHLSDNIDILKQLQKVKLLKIGFALETNNSESNALKKMSEKKLDYIVLNSPDNLESDKGSCTLFSSNGEKVIIENVNKFEMAEKILRWIKC